MKKIRITLAEFLNLLSPMERVFIMHDMGERTSEAVAEGTVEDIQKTDCVKVCGGNIVKIIAADMDEWPEATAPVLLITIGGKLENE